MSIQTCLVRRFILLCVAVVTAACAGSEPTPGEGPDFDDLADFERGVGLGCGTATICSGASGGTNEVYTSLYRIGASSTAQGALLQTFASGSASGVPTRVRLRLRALRPFAPQATAVLHVGIHQPDDAAAPEAPGPLLASGTYDLTQPANGPDGTYEIPLAGEALVAGRTYALAISTDPVPEGSSATLLFGVGALLDPYGAGDAFRRTQRYANGTWGASRFRSAGTWDVAFALTLEEPAAAPPVFVGVSSAQTQTTQAAVVVNRPSGVQAGDLLVAAFVDQGSLPTPPAGWTQAGTLLSSAYGYYYYALWKVAGPSEPSSYTFQVSNALAGYNAVVLAYRNVAFGSLGSWTESTGSLSLPSVSGTAAGDLGLAIAFDRSMGALAGPAGSTTRYSYANNQGSYWSGLVAEFGISSSSTGPVSVSRGVTQYNAAGVIATLRPSNPVFAGVSPASADFGSVVVGATATRTFTVSNAGASALNLSALSLIGNGFAAAGGTCAVGTPVAAGASCTVVVAFSPTTTGSLSGTLTVGHGGSGSPLEATLSGNGISAVVYATWNPADKYASLALGNGNLTVTASEGGVWRSVRADKSKSSGKWYWEITLPNGTGNVAAGISDANVLVSGYPGTSNQAGWIVNSTGVFHGGVTNTGAVGPIVAGAGDVLSFALDLDNRRLFVARNGVWQGAGDPVTGSSPAAGLPAGAFFPMLTALGPGSATANFGQSAFQHPVPSGYGAGVW